MPLQPKQGLTATGSFRQRDKQQPSIIVLNKDRMWKKFEEMSMCVLFYKAPLLKNTQENKTWERHYKLKYEPLDNPILLIIQSIEKNQKNNQIDYTCELHGKNNQINQKQLEAILGEIIANLTNNNDRSYHEFIQMLLEGHYAQPTKLEFVMDVV